MDDARLEALDKRIQALEDMEAIRRLRMMYHHFTNEGMFDQISSLFTDDGKLDFGYVAKAQGREEIHEVFLRVPRNLALVKQFIHNHIVDVDGDRATGISYLDARYAQDGESVMVAARFNEVYRRTDAGWKISEMLVHIYFSTPISVGWASEKLNYVKPFT